LPGILHGIIQRTRQGERHLIGRSAPLLGALQKAAHIEVKLEHSDFPAGYGV
jgi:hypothetical protein